MNRVAFISRINLIGGRTNVYNFAKTCEAVNSQYGFSTMLVTTDQPRDTAVFFKKMGIKKPFEVVSLGVTNTLSTYGGHMWYELWAFIRANTSLMYFLVKKNREINTVYFRDESLFLTALFAKLCMRKKVFFEIHSVYERKYRQLKNILAARFSDGIVAISSGLVNHYEKENKNIILSLCSAAEDSWFDHSKNRFAFRKILNLPMDPFIIGYAGVVGINPNNDYYELDDIVKSLETLPKNIVFVVVGEIRGNAEWLREVAKDVRVLDRLVIIRWQERSMIPKYLQAFDAIVIPRRKKNLVGDSPAKMFPALAARRPIIAGNAESIEEVLTNMKDSLIVRENNSEGWADAIAEIYNNPYLAEKISAGAEVTKGLYTWEKRGASIADFIDRTIGGRNKKSR